MEGGRKRLVVRKKWKIGGKKKFILIRLQSRIKELLYNIVYITVSCWLLPALFRSMQARFPLGAGLVESRLCQYLLGSR